MRRYLADLAAGARILASRRFWRDFYDYWFGDSLVARLDAFIERLRRAK